MAVRLLVFLGALGACTGVASAQSPVTLYAGAALGLGSQQYRFPVETSPPTRSHATSSTSNVLAAGAIGVSIGGHLGVDATLRSTLEAGHPFRAISVGPTISWGSERRVSIRAGLGWIQGSEAVMCLDPQISCHGYISEWVRGFDVSIGVDLRRGSRWAAGPSVWWAQSTGSDSQYRSLGLALQVRFQ